MPYVAAVSFRERAMNEISLLLKMIYKDKASYASSPVYYNERNAAPPRHFETKIPRVSENFRGGLKTL